MSVAKFIIFLKKDEPSETEQLVMDKLHQAEILYFVDKVHSKDYQWFKTNFKQTDCRFFWDEVLKAAEYSFLTDDYFPTMVVYFDDCASIETRDWVYIVQYVRHVVLGTDIDPYALRLGKSYVMGVPKTLPTDKPIVTTTTAPDDPDRQHYSVRSIEIKERDAKFYELWKPHVDTPYTVMVQPYSQKGDARFFSSLFACSSWGVARLDAEFLRHVWRDMGLPGTMDLDALIKEHVEDCTPSEKSAGEAEPKVYRLTIEQLLIQLQDKLEGHMKLKRRLESVE